MYFFFLVIEGFCKLLVLHLEMLKGLDFCICCNFFWVDLTIELFGISGILL